MPHPIQDASLSDRLRRFFHLRGRTNFSLDETVVPMVMLEDLSAQRFPTKTIFGMQSSRAGPLSATISNPSLVSIQFGDPALDPELEPFDGLWTIDSLGVALDTATSSALALGDSIQFSVKLGDKVSLQTEGPPDDIRRVGQILDWSNYPSGTGVKRIPVAMSSWRQGGGTPGGPLGEAIARFPLGVGQNPNQVGALGTGLGIVMDNRETVFVSPVAPIELPVGQSISFYVNMSGHYDPDATR